MSFLTKLGKVLLNVIGVVTGVAPLIGQYVSSNPKVQGDIAAVADKLQQSFNVIITAEQMFANTGAVKAGSDKLKAATPFVAQLIQQTDMLVGHQPQDTALFQDASTRLTAALADVLRSYGH